jgi:glycerophosphoryl diester phosphodiesterase
MKIKIWAHRGYSYLYPDNTMLSFKKALSAGADGIECDIQKTHDNQFVIVHDSFIVSGNNKLYISKTTLEELRKIDLGYGEKIITLKELITFFPEGKTLDIELKSDTITENDCTEIFRIMKSTDKNLDYYICSFKLTLLNFFIKKHITVGYLTGFESFRDGFITILRNIKKIKGNYLSIPVLLFPPVICYITKFFVKALKLLGYRFNFWTVNSKRYLKRIKGLGNIIITDKVKEFVKILES